MDLEIRQWMYNLIYLTEKYIDGDVYGISGIERVYEEKLKGDNGIEYHIFDSYGIDQGQSDHIDSIKPIAGTNLYTTINNDLQFHAVLAA